MLIDRFMTATSAYLPVTVSAAFAMVALSQGAVAEDLRGELVFLQWQAGSQAEMWKELEADFIAAHPGVTIRELGVTRQGDARGGIRTVLMSGETVDLIINGWPAFREELAHSDVIQPIDAEWASFKWDDRLSKSWRDLSTVAGVTYGVTYTYGDRSGIWFKPATLAKAGIQAAPATWNELLASFAALKAVGIDAPVGLPGKKWAHAEWFETLLIRTAGIETAKKLAAHEIPWTDPAVKTALLKYADMLNAGCCAPAETMLSNHWDNVADLVATDKNAYLLIGMWVDAYIGNNHKLKAGTDYSFFQFPALGFGHDDTAIADSVELLITKNSAHKDIAVALMDYMTTVPATKIMAKYQYASPSSLADPTLLGPIQQIATKAVANAKVMPVLGDLLPGDLVDEYRVQLQRFLKDPSEATIEQFQAALEAKAASSY